MDEAPSKGVKPDIRQRAWGGLPGDGQGKGVTASARAWLNENAPRENLKIINDVASRS